ncbi:DUF2806 domain-containing protein [Rhizobium leguminosarum]|uniref:DUF2806 domain-containing protein n=1 Tax=Rhizobium leguminosarum TaxID=384 RepID=UPI0003763D48|nr:DUF2806 domain-containing protein [Rhizobium leguminosarum]
MSEIIKKVGEAGINIAEKFALAIGGKYLAEKMATAKAAADLIEFRAAQARLDEETDANERRDLRAVVQAKRLQLEKALVEAEGEKLFRKLGNLTNTLQIAADLSEGHEDVFERDPLFDDWIYQWQSYAENISDEQIQRLWARILLSARSTSGRPSLLALDALRFFDRTAAGAFIVLCRRLAYSDRLLSDELRLLSEEFDLADEIGRLEGMRLVSPSENGQTFVQVMGLTINLQEAAANTEGNPFVYRLTETGRELAASFAPDWVDRRKHYASLTAKGSDPAQFTLFRSEDKHDIEGYFRNLAKACVARTRAGTHYANLRNFREHDKLICELESSSGDPIKFFFESKLEDARASLSDLEYTIAEEFCTSLNSFASGQASDRT